MTTTKPKMDFTRLGTLDSTIMEYHRMSLAELKTIARDHEPAIKQYYIKSRLELIRLLTMKELPTSYILEKKTIAQLRKEATAKGYTTMWNLRRSELMELLYPSTQKDHHDHKHAEEHDDPKDG
jgi:hypothetical protein